MPDEPTPLNDSTPSPDDEWTDDVPLSPEDETPVVASSDPAADDWDDDPAEWEDMTPDRPPVNQTTSTREALAWLIPLWRRGVTFWQRLLAGIKTRIPAAASLSNGLLSGLLIGVLVLLIVVINGVRHPAQSAESSPAIADEPTPVTSPDAAPPASPAADEPAPTTPDAAATRDRIDQLQSKLLIDELADDKGLVESVQADFVHNQLTVVLNSNWYRLSEQAQNDLVAKLFNRSSQLDFANLALRSPAGDLLARSPVVGDTMVIFQREPLPEVEPPPKPRYRLMIDR